jgi:1-acyl-sn-glycerol-3-phosphate acyltransferase
MIQWSRGYENLRYYVSFAYWLSHKKIVVTGLENIPKDKPVIFAVNHQNALMDPMALVCTNDLQTVWLTRADVFKGRAIQAFLRFLKMSPVYRIRDGKENLANNEQVFDLVTRLLEEKKSVALFPEASHSGKRQMLSHKKAIPRMALEAEEKNNFQLNLMLVPVGIYYDNYWNFNRTVIVQYGKPFEVDSYKDRYAENPQNTMLVMRDDIYSHLEPLVIQINSAKFYSDYEDIRTIAGKDYAKNKFFSKNPVLQLFKAEQQLIAQIEQIENSKPEIFSTIREKVNLYVRNLKKAGISDDQVIKTSNNSSFLLVVQLIAAVLSLPLFVWGFAFNALPYYIPRLFITNKLKDKAFISSFNFAVGLVLFPVFYLLESALILFFSGSVIATFISLVYMPYAGKIAYNLYEFYSNLAVAIQYKFFLRNRFKKIFNLRRDFINTLIKNLALNYINKDRIGVDVHTY